MLSAKVIVVVPTLTAGSTLLECLASLERQSFRDFEVIVIDNSGADLVNRLGRLPGRVFVHANAVNVGFGAAINQGSRMSRSTFVATLNDDAVAGVDWLKNLLSAALRSTPTTGMFASRVQLVEERLIDSAGMSIAADGSSKQRGHARELTSFLGSDEVLLPSGSAALYRRDMLDQMEGFDEDFFLYCEDTDLGLRCRRAGWSCLYVADAVVDHHYSHSAGRASALKAYYVERNRLYLVLKTFPSANLLVVPFCSAIRYGWHVFYLLQGRGAASTFSASSSPLRLVWFIVKAHWEVIRNAGSLLRKRRRILAESKLSSAEFKSLLAEHSISLRKVAAL